MIAQVVNLLTRKNHIWEYSQTIEDIVLAIKNQNGKPSISGQFSFFMEDDQDVFLLRDPLGINKFFYAIHEGSLYLSNTILDLVIKKIPYDSIYSVPPGSMLQLSKTSGAKIIRPYFEVSKIEYITDFNQDRFTQTVSHKLKSFFQLLSRDFSDYKVVVCLSGGLDSTIVATLADAFLKDLTIASFSYCPEEIPNGILPDSYQAHKLSDDFQAAYNISKILGSDFLPVIATKNQITGIVDDCLAFGQDWRDFNVHCSVVNYFLGQAIRNKFTDRKILVLTGDLMNEFVADYAPVIYKNAEYYPQPKIPKNKINRMFVMGLDTSDREIGIFDKFDIMAVQPFAVVCEDYLSIPKDVLEMPNLKETLNLPLITNEEIRNQVTKVKVRAQVGGKDGGTLGFFHDNQLTQEYLKKQWVSIFSKYSVSSDYFSIIYAGRYRS